MYYSVDTTVISLCHMYSKHELTLTGMATAMFHCSNINILPTISKGLSKPIYTGVSFRSDIDLL